MDYLAAWMFFALTVLLLAGFPVAFTLMGTALAFGLVGFGWNFFNLLPMRIWGIMSNYTLIAVPLFIFMGVMLERSGLASNLLRAMAMVFGRLRGGLAVSVVVVGALLGASTGIVGATVVTMGLLALPAMMENSYQHELATGTIAASGTLGQIIPPSIVLVLLGDIIGVSVGELFIGAVLPGLLLVAAYCIYIMLFSAARPDAAPPVLFKPKDADGQSMHAYVLKALVPPLTLMILVLGSIFAGIASPTEAAGVGAAGATLLCMANRRLDLDVLRQVMETTTRLTSMVFVILAGAAAFGLVFRGLGGDTVIREFVTHIPFGKWGVLLTVMMVIFVAGFFLDFIEITFIHIPVLAPIMKSYGFDPVWFSILFAVNLQTSFLTPPFGFALFYLKGVAPSGIETTAIYRGIIPFVLLQVVVLGIIILWPEVATWLPGIMAAR